MSDGLGQRLKTARRSMKWEQKDLAKQLEVSVGTVGRWEREVTRPSAAEISALCQALRVRTAWLADGEEPMQSPMSLFLGPGSGKTMAFRQTELNNQKTIENQYIFCNKEITLQDNSDGKTITKEGSVVWDWITKSFEEVMAYIEIAESISGTASPLRQKLPVAVMVVYHYLVNNGGSTPHELRDMHNLMRELV